MKCKVGGNLGPGCMCGNIICSTNDCGAEPGTCEHQDPATIPVQVDNLSDAEFLRWVKARLVNVYGENELLAHNHRLQKIIDGLYVDEKRNEQIAESHICIGLQEETIKELQSQIQSLNKAINFTLDECDSDPIPFLRCWREGDFESCKSEWGYQDE